ncbi:MAG: four helix bundle protein [Patescibacteria group bacterium]|jgi:hypothetical protein
MSNTNKPEIYLALYELTKYLYCVHRNMPKQFKYTLGQGILDLSWGCLDIVLVANRLPNKEKFQKILYASGVFDQLKARLRMAHELKLLSHNQYAYIIEQNEEIGKMLTGWLNWAKRQ